MCADLTVQEFETIGKIDELTADMTNTLVGKYEIIHRAYVISKQLGIPMFEEEDDYKNKQSIFSSKGGYGAASNIQIKDFKAYLLFLTQLFINYDNGNEVIREFVDTNYERISPKYKTIEGILKSSNFINSIETNAANYFSSLDTELSRRFYAFIKNSTTSKYVVKNESTADFLKCVFVTFNDALNAYSYTKQSTFAFGSQAQMLAYLNSTTSEKAQIQVARLYTKCKEMTTAKKATGKGKAATGKGKAKTEKRVEKKIEATNDDEFQVDDDEVKLEENPL